MKFLDTEMLFYSAYFNHKPDGDKTEASPTYLYVSENQVFAQDAEEHFSVFLNSDGIFSFSNNTKFAF